MRISETNGQIDYIAIIADMVDSRDISFESRPGVQQRFTEFVESLNVRFAASIASHFTITLGDEFQVVLWNGDQIPDILWALEEDFPERRLRVGIGYGPLTTILPERASHADGPALHTARLAIQTAKQKNWLGGVFLGFGRKPDDVLNGLARLLEQQRQALTRTQRLVVSTLRQVETQVEAAARLNKSKQSLNNAAKRAGWEAYHQGELALAAMLSMVSEAAS